VFENLVVPEEESKDFVACVPWRIKTTCSRKGKGPNSGQLGLRLLFRCVQRKIDREKETRIKIVKLGAEGGIKHQKKKNCVVFSDPFPPICSGSVEWGGGGSGESGKGEKGRKKLGKRSIVWPRGEEQSFGSTLGVLGVGGTPPGAGPLTITNMPEQCMRGGGDIRLPEVVPGLSGGGRKGSASRGKAFVPHAPHVPHLSVFTSPPK